MRTRPRPTPEFLQEFPWLAPDPEAVEREADRPLPKALIHPRRWPRKRKTPNHPSAKGG
jgi:hypothetical protein